MSQSKLGSVLEAAANIAVGYFISLLAQLVIFPFYGVTLPLHDNVMIGLWFTLVSFIRSYMLRRYFNKVTYDGRHKR